VGDKIREVCLMSIICSVASNLAPEGAVKRIMGICSSLILFLIIAGPLGEFDMGKYADSLAKYRELETQMSIEAENAKSRINRLVIEEEYKTYIMDKAKEKNISVLEVSLEFSWSTGEYWVPCSVTLVSDETAEIISAFSRILHSELGISEDKIIWQTPN